MFPQHRNHVVDRGIDAGGGGVAARLDGRVAAVTGVLIQLPLAIPPVTSGLVLIIGDTCQGKSTTIANLAVRMEEDAAVAWRAVLEQATEELAGTTAALLAEGGLKARFLSTLPFILRAAQVRVVAEIET